jgi:hypothetical protein
VKEGERERRHLRVGSRDHVSFRPDGFIVRSFRSRRTTPYWEQGSLSCWMLSLSAPIGIISTTPTALQEVAVARLDATRAFSGCMSVRCTSSQCPMPISSNPMAPTIW